MTLLALTLAGSAVALDTIHFVSSADDTKQPALFYAPKDKQNVPLIVALHPWSEGYKTKKYKWIAKQCKDTGWAFIQPHFRGPNKRPEATGSELVVKDILSAVDYARQNASIDPRGIYLLGTSGGGHAALLMAGRHPKVWAGVSAWCGITDLEAWYRQCKATGRKYYHNIAASCGGPPGSNDKVDAEYKQRSPLTHLPNARELRIHINVGIHDGHRGSVPVSHSLLAFNVLAQPEDRLTAAEIETFVKTRKVPQELRAKVEDKSYGKRRLLFRRTSANVTVSVYDDGHGYVPGAAWQWLQKLNVRPRKDD